MKIDFRQMCITFCGKLGPNEGQISHKLGHADDVNELSLTRKKYQSQQLVGLVFFAFIYFKSMNLAALL